MTQLYILTGFLGAGKTTFMLKMMEQLKDKKLGIIQNESGKVGVDGAILRKDQVEMIELNNGSIFCSCHKNGFVTTLATMAKRNFEYLLVESTGIGDPSNVDEIVKKANEAAEGCIDFKGVICIVDAVNFMWQLAKHEEAMRQVKHCNMAIISKSDLSPQGTQEVETAIRGINALCPIYHSVNGEMDMGFLNEDLLRYHNAEAEESINSKDNRPKTVFINVKQPVDKKEFMAFLKAIGPKVLRVKGFTNVEGSGMCQVDVVGKVMAIRPTELTENAQLVFISANGLQVIKDVFTAWKETMSVPMEIKN